MKKRVLFPFISLASIVALTSCGIFNYHSWSWQSSTADGVIKYCLLIGQLDHNDSMDRTRGTREELNTRCSEEYQMNNFNLEDPVTGDIDLLSEGGYNRTDGVHVPQGHYKVREIEHGEQKSLAGTTWDPITANSSANTWIAKHGKDITMFVSNNDGMAEGAHMACNWYKGMPIFGYDANASTLELIREGEIMGTIDSNTPGQTLASTMIIRNIIDAIRADGGKISDEFNPCGYGFTYAEGSNLQKKYAPNKDPETNTYHSNNQNGYGFMSSAITFDGCDDDQLIIDDVSKAEELGAKHAILVDNNAITKFAPVGDLPGRKSVDDYYDAKTGEPLKKQIIAERDESHVFNTTPTKKEPIRLWQSYYSNSDVYFTGNMQPYFDIFQSVFNFGGTEYITQQQGNGTEESVNLNALESTLTKDKKPEAYLINVVKQPNSLKYITTIAEKLGIQEKDKWKERSDIPIIFWNRQPTNDEGKISYDVMCNKYFKYTYYVGFGAAQGGNLQGKMVKAWLENAYVDNYQK